MFVKKEDFDRMSSYVASAARSTSTNPYVLYNRYSTSNLDEPKRKSKPHMTTRNFYASTVEKSRRVLDMDLSTPTPKVQEVKPVTPLPPKDDKDKEKEKREEKNKEKCYWEDTMKPDAESSEEEKKKYNKPKEISQGTQVPNPMSASPVTSALISALRKRRASDGNTTQNGVCNAFLCTNKKPKMMFTPIRLNPEFIKSIEEKPWLSKMPNLLEPVSNNQPPISSSAVFQKQLKSTGQELCAITTLRKRPTKMANGFLNMYDPMKLLSRLNRPRRPQAWTIFMSNYIIPIVRKTPPKVICIESFPANRKKVSPVQKFPENVNPDQKLNCKQKDLNISESRRKSVMSRQISSCNVQKSPISSNTKLKSDKQVHPTQKCTKNNKLPANNGHLKRLPKYQKKKRKHRVKYIVNSQCISHQRMRAKAALYLKRAFDTYRKMRSRSKESAETKLTPVSSRSQSDSRANVTCGGSGLHYDGKPLKVKFDGNESGNAVGQNTGNVKSVLLQTTGQGGSGNLAVLQKPGAEKTTLLQKSGNVKLTGAANASKENPALLQTIGNPALLQAIGKSALLQTPGKSALLQSFGKSAVLQTTGGATPSQGTGKSLLMPPTSRGNSLLVPPTSRINSVLVPPTGRVNSVLVPPTIRGNSVLVPPTGRVNSVLAPPTDRVNSVLVPPTGKVNAAIVTPTSHVNSLMVHPSSKVNTVLVQPSNKINLVQNSSTGKSALEQKTGNAKSALLQKTSKRKSALVEKAEKVKSALRSKRSGNHLKKDSTKWNGKFLVHNCAFPVPSCSRTKYTSVDHPRLRRTVELLRHKRQLQDQMESMEGNGVVYKLNPLPPKPTVPLATPFLTRNIQLPSRETKQIMSHKIIFNLAHAGFTHAKMRPVEVLTDVVSSFLTKIAKRLKAVTEIEMFGADHQFPDPMERVLHEIGMGGIRGLEEFYRTKIIEYGQRIEEQCHLLRRQYAYKVRSKIGLSNSTSSSTFSTSISNGISATTTSPAKSFGGGSSSIGASGSKPVVINSSKSSCITTSIANTTSSSQPLSPGNSVLAEMLSSQEEPQVRVVQCSPLSAVGQERQLEDLMGAPPPNVELKPGSFHSRQQLPLHHLIASLSQPGQMNQQQTPPLVFHTTQSIQSTQSPGGNMTVQPKKGFQQQLFQNTGTQQAFQQPLQSSLRGLHQQQTVGASQLTAVVASQQALSNHQSLLSPQPSMTKQLSSVASHQSSVASQISTIASRQLPVASNQSSIAVQQSSVATPQTSVVSLQSSIASLQASTVATRQLSVPSHQSSVTTHQSQVASQLSSLASPQSSVTSPQSTVTGHQSSVASQLSSLSSHQLSVPSHQSSLASHLSSMTSNQSSIAGQLSSVASQHLSVVVAGKLSSAASQHLSGTGQLSSTANHQSPIVTQLSSVANRISTVPASRQSTVASQQSLMTSPQLLVTGQQSIGASHQQSLEAGQQQSIVTSQQSLITGQQSLLTSQLGGQQSLVAGQQLLVSSQPSLVAGQQLLVASQPSLVTGQQSLIANQQSLVTGHQLLVSTQPSLVTGQQLLVTSQPSLVAGQQSLITNQQSLVQPQQLLVATQPSLMTGQQSLIASQQSLVGGQQLLVTSKQSSAASQQPHLTQLLQRPVALQGSPNTTFITTPAGHLQENQQSQQQHLILHQPQNQYQGVVIQGNQHVQNLQQTNQSGLSALGGQHHHSLTTSQRGIKLQNASVSSPRQFVTIPIQLNLSKSAGPSQIIPNEHIIGTSNLQKQCQPATMKNPTSSSTKGKTVTIIRSASVSSPGIVCSGDKGRLITSNQNTTASSPASIDVFSDYSPVSNSNPPTPNLHHQLQQNTNSNNIISINLGSSTIDLDTAVAQPQTVTMHAVETPTLSQSSNPNAASKAKLKEALNQRNLLRLNFEQVPNAGDSTVLLSSCTPASVNTSGGSATTTVSNSGNAQFLGKVSSGQTISWTNNFP